MPDVYPWWLCLLWQLAMASMAGMDTGVEAQNIDLGQVRTEMKVIITFQVAQLCVGNPRQWL